MRFLIFLFILSLSACGDRSAKGTNTAAEYFDMKGFFEKESLRLSRLNAPVLKKVSRNSIAETRKVKVNWGNELSLFKESDINKPAWKNSYRKVSGTDVIEYLALEDNLRTRKIKITRIDGRIKSICIINRTSNLLYTSTEDLLYYPDSVYVIKKEQKVKVLGTNLYSVNGRFR